jgi:GntR family transcriptional regulator
MDDTSYKPAYAAIADDLRGEIERGELKSGDKLPSEREICERWGVSTITARAAITALRNEGLVRSMKGKGVFVRKEKPLVRISPDRYLRPHNKPTWVIESERANRNVDVQHVTRTVPAPDRVADRLGIEEGDMVTETDYLIKMGDQPVSMSQAWEPFAITGGTEIELPHEGPYGGRGIVPRFDSIGYNPTRVDEVLEIRMPTPTERKRLDIPASVPVVEIHQTFWAGETPVETATIVFPGDRYQLHYKMPLPATPQPGPDGVRTRPAKPPTIDSGWEHVD